MKSKRKWLASILSVVMTMTFMPAYAFAGEAAEGGAGADAVWTVKNADGKVVGNYNEMQDAVNAFKTTVKTDTEDNTSWGKIVLNRDARGSGVVLEFENEDSNWFQYDFDFNGHTYTIEEGTETGPGGEDTYIVGIYDRTYKDWAFKNGTLKIEKSAAGIDGESVQLNNFNIDASNTTECTEVMNLQGTPTSTPVKKPGQVKGLKLKAGKKKVTVTYKKVSGATSYKVTYSTSKKFKKAKTVTVKSGKTVKKTISKLKSKKRYYVKVCAVKKVKGKNYTGKWSAVKKVKVK